MRVNFCGSRVFPPFLQFVFVCSRAVSHKGRSPASDAVGDRINKFEKTQRGIPVILKIEHSWVDGFITDNANDIE